MLTRWREFIEEVDPDLIIGYNISQFDLPYLIDRAKALKATAFPYMGRLKGELASEPGFLPVRRVCGGVRLPQRGADAL